MERGSENKTLHVWSIAAIRAAPFFLAALSTFMVMVGALGDRPDAVAVALVTVGAFVGVAAAVLPRVSGELSVGTSGVKAGTIAALSDVDSVSGAIVIEPPAAITVEQRAITRGSRAQGLTYKQLVAHAKQAGWVVSEGKGGHVVLTRLQASGSDVANEGDTVSVVVPTTGNEIVPPALVNRFKRFGVLPPD